MNKTTCAPSATEKPSEAGFSLIEVMIAIIVLVFGILGVANLIVIAAASNMVGNHATAAVSVATEKMELLKSAPWGSPLLAVGRTTETVEMTGAGKERVTAVQVVTTIRAAGPALHIIVVATPINAFNAGTYSAGTDVDNPPATRSQAVFTTIRAIE
jgi:prepilin-type N-terminal cleavage/methylation domain-containing protein